MQLAPGAAVTPAMRLVRHLDGGGMGQVWVAEHAGLGRQVAVKIMSPQMIAVPGAAQRFAREASAAAQIQSPHVVQVFEQGLTNDGTPFIVMELLAGEDLAHRLQRRGPMDPTVLALVVRQVASALERAHASGVVHRDIKPANVFLVEVGAETVAKVLDFGIAMQAEDVRVTSTGMMVGSPAYMSPEQILDPRGVDNRCDLWALAVVAYECLTGALPFQADTVGALCIAIERSQFLAATKRVPALPSDIDAFFTRALNRDPGRRFPSAQALGAAFAQAVGVRFADAPAPSDPGLGAPPPAPLADGAPDPSGGSRVTYVILGAVLSFCWLAAGTYFFFPQIRFPPSSDGSETPAEPHPPAPSATATASPSAGSTTVIDLNADGGAGRATPSTATAAPPAPPAPAATEPRSPAPPRGNQRR